MPVVQKLGAVFGGRYDKDNGMLGPFWAPYLWKLFLWAPAVDGINPA